MVSKQVWVGNPNLKYTLQMDLHTNMSFLNNNKCNKDKKNIEIGKSFNEKNKLLENFLT